VNGRTHHASTRGSIAALLLAATVAVGVATAAPAGAISTCSFDKVLAVVTVSLTTSASMAAPLGTIELGGLPCTTSGGQAATVTTTDTINVTGGVGGEIFTIGLQSGPFAPGKTNEPGTSDEIEWTIDLAGGMDSVVIGGADTDDNIRMSATAINLNAAEGSPDDDVTLTSVESGAAFGAGGNDVIDATGFAGDVTIYGSDGTDTLTGGSGPDHIYGENDADVLAGGPNNDTIDDGQGDDTLDGGAGDDNLFMDDVPNGTDVVAGGSGSDYVMYHGRTASVDVTLDNNANDGDPSANGGAGEQDNVQTDVENVLTGTGSDTIVGSGKVNSLNGGSGKDRITGKGGEDFLTGGDGGDRFFAMDGLHDVVDGGAGTDFCQCDAIDQQIDIP